MFASISSGDGSKLELDLAPYKDCEALGIITALLTMQLGVVDFSSSGGGTRNYLVKLSPEQVVVNITKKSTLVENVEGNV